MDGSTTLRVLFGLGMGAAACLVVVNGQTPPNPSAFEAASIAGLISAFDIDLTWELEETPNPDGTARPGAPSTDGGHLFTAIQEQLGLKLDAQRGPVDVIVIDSAHRPIED